MSRPVGKGTVQGTVQGTVHLTDAKVQEIVEDDSNNTYVYGYKGGEQLENVLPMRDVLDRVDRCVALGTPAACMADEELAAFARTHPRIFAGVTSGQRRKIQLIRSMVETKARCETAEEDEKARAMAELHLKWMGFDRSARRKMMRNFGKTDKAQRKRASGR